MHAAVSIIPQAHQHSSKAALHSALKTFPRASNRHHKSSSAFSMQLRSQGECVLCGDVQTTHQSTGLEAEDSLERS